MTKKLSGMKNPMKNAGGLRHVFGVLVVILLASALLIGAASAVQISEQEYQLDVYENGTLQPIPRNSDGKYYDIYTLAQSAKGRIIFHSGADSPMSNGSLILRATNGAVLNGTITIFAPGNVTIQDMTLELGQEYKNAGDDYTTAISLRANGVEDFIVENTTIRFTDAQRGEALRIAGDSACVISGDIQFSNNRIYNVTNHVVTIPVGHTYSETSSITINGNNVFMNPSKEERALFKVYLPTVTGSVNYNIYDNVVNKFDGCNYDAIAMCLDGTVTGKEKISLNMWNNSFYTLNEQSKTIWERMLGGDSGIYGHQLGLMKVWETEEKNALVLSPGLNMTKVEWDGNTVNISESGNYIPKADGIVLSAKTVAGVKINGADVNTATLTIEGKTSVENVTTSDANTAELTAKVSATDGLKREVVWSVKSGGENITLGTPTDNKVTYTAKQVGTATIKAEIASGVYKEIAVTVFGEAKAETDAEIGEIDSDGNVTISKSTSGNDKLVLDGTVIDSSTSTTVDAGKSVTLATESGVNVSLTYGEGATITSGEVKGKVTEIEATYPQTTAASENVEGVVSYGLVLTLKTEALNGSLILPTISPEFNETVSKKIDTTLYTALTMITATANVGEINGNLTDGGIELTFIIPQKAVTEKGKIRVLHVDGTNPPSEVSISTPTDDGKGNWIVKAQGDTFSSYVLTEYIYVAKDTTPSSSSSSGSSVWLTETPTETPTPTPTETVPTDTVPTDIPSTQPTEEPSSPGFGMLAVLAGLGTVAVLRRK